MIGDPYDVFDDPYCYKGTDVLKNKARLRNAERLSDFELEMTTLRASDPLPAGRFDPKHYCAVHRYLFQDVYAWAGRYRTVRTSKGGNHFCFPEHIEREMARLFVRLHAPAFTGGASRREFVSAASDFLAELNVIHCFREGNGRSQLAFLALVGGRAGHRLQLDAIDDKAFLRAMITSFSGNTRALEKELSRLI